MLISPVSLLLTAYSAPCSPLGLAETKPAANSRDSNNDFISIAGSGAWEVSLERVDLFGGPGEEGSEWIDM